MKTIITSLFALAVAPVGAEARELRDPEARFKINVPDNWSATTQSAKNGSSIFWAFLSPQENFRIVIRADRSRDKTACKKLLSAYEKEELKARFGGAYKKVPPTPEQQKEMSDNNCGGMYVGARKNKTNVERPYIVILEIERKGDRIYHWLGEAENSEFEQRGDEFTAIFDSIELL